MILRRGRNKVVIECDVGTEPGCVGEFTLDDSDFHATLSAAKQQGWEIKKFKDEWLHACPGCML